MLRKGIVEEWGESGIADERFDLAEFEWTSEDADPAEGGEDDELPF